MVRSGDDYRLDILVVEDGAKILEALGFAVGQFESAIQIGLEGIGNGDGVDLAGAEEVPQVELTHSAGADQAHADAVVGSQNAAGKRPCGSDRAHGGTCEALVEVPTSYLKVGHFSPHLHFSLASDSAKRSARRPGHFRAICDAGGKGKRFNTEGTEGVGTEPAEKREK